MLRVIGGGGGDPPPALGVAPGGLIKQCIVEDTYPAAIWERDRTICFNVQILNSDMFQRVTGKAPPATPVSAKTYANAGLPFYEIYGETSTVKGDFNGIKSVRGLDMMKNMNGKREDEGDGVLESNKKAKGCSDTEDDSLDDDNDEEDSDKCDKSDSDEGDEDDSDEDDSDEEDSDEDDDNYSDSDEDESPVDDDDDGQEQPLQTTIIMLNPDGSAKGLFTPVSELKEELSRFKSR